MAASTASWAATRLLPPLNQDPNKAFLENPRVLPMVDDNIQRIEAYLYLYENLIGRMQPLKKPGRTGFVCPGT